MGQPIGKAVIWFGLFVPAKYINVSCTSGHWWLTYILFNLPGPPEQSWDLQCLAYDAGPAIFPAFRTDSLYVPTIGLWNIQGQISPPASRSAADAAVFSPFLFPFSLSLCLSVSRSPSLGLRKEEVCTSANSPSVRAAPCVRACVSEAELALAAEAEPSLC